MNEPDPALGSTGDSPVPPGNLPDGTTCRQFATGGPENHSASKVTPLSVGASPTEAGGSPALPLPPRIPDHELIKRIGRGAYGEVWLARSVTGAYRAVKIVTRNSFDHERPFEREFEGILKFEPISRRHESQVDILHVGRGDGYFYYVMELADDVLTGGQIHPDNYSPRTLKSDVFQRARIPFEECVQIGIALTTALENLHENGLVHRDVKPSNIIFVNGVPKLADIGLVAGVDATHTYVGTEGFAAPEGSGTAQADLYSLGKVLYEIATGKDRQEFPELPTQLRELPDREGLMELNAVIARACRHDPKDRYTSATEMRADLELLQSGKSLARLHRIERRLRFVTRAAVVVTAVTLLSLGAWAYQTRQTRIVRKLANEKTQLAEENRQRAGEQMRQRERVEAAERVVRRNLYAADVNLAQQAIEAGNLGRARHLLDLHNPANGEEDLRGFEWRYLRSRCKGDQLRILRHDDDEQVASVAYSADGAWIASGTPKGLRLWNAKTGALAAHWPDESGRILSLAFSPNSALLASAGERQIVLWDVRLLQPIATNTCKMPRVAFDPANVSRLAIAEGGNIWGQSGGQIRLWNYSGSQAMHSLPDSGNRVAFSPDGKLFATANWQKTVRIWDSSTEKLVKAATGIGDVMCLAFAPNNQQVAIATRYGEIQLWDLHGPKPFVLRKPTGEYVTSLAYSHDGRILAAGRQTHEIQLWDVVEGVEVDRLIGHSAEVWSLALSPDGRTLISGAYDGTVRCWDTAPRRQRESITNLSILSYRWGGHPTFSPDGRLLAGGTRDGHVQIWDVATQKVGSVLTNAGLPVGFSRDATTLLSANPDFTTLQRWNLETGHRLRSVPLQRSKGNSFYDAISADQRMALVYYFKTPCVELLDAETGALIDTLKISVVPHTFSPTFESRVSISEDDRFMALSGLQAKAELWDLRGRKLLYALHGHRDVVDCVAFSLDSKWLATGSWDSTAKLWDTASGRELATLSGHKAGVLSVAFSPDGKTLATSSDDVTVKLWHLTTFRELITLRMQEPVRCLKFSPDGKTLITGGGERDSGTLRLWRAPSFTEIDALNGR